jgi:hypothetical protein
MRQRYSKALVYAIAILSILLILVFVFLKQPAI